MEDSGLADNARPYQLELLDAALEENTIVLLGTGSGKTFIAVMLLKQMSYMILDSYKANPHSKRTIFLVNTVPLVEQQASYIKAHVPLNVGSYYGEMGVDYWNATRWEVELEANNILVMTRQIFLNMLTHGFINISRVNLLIFDECHHAVKKDPYVQIMTFYNDCPSQRPKILGLTASIISGKCKPDQLERKIRDLESVLCCRTETAKDLAEVAKYATNPDEVLVKYSSITLTAGLKSVLEDFLRFLELQASKNNIAGDLKSLIEETLYVLENVSVSAAVKTVNQILIADVKEILDTVAMKPWNRRLCESTLLQADIFVKKCESFLRENGNDHSQKLTKLLEILADTNPCFNPHSMLQDENSICGIIFVERRAAAVCLSNFLQELQDEGGCLNHIRSHYIVGHTGKGGCNMNVKKQQNTLREFRSGAINFLVATSVVEEGLDVRKCNLVIRYDFPKTFQSHVQSKGRARAKNSQYILLVEDTEYNEQKLKLDNYFKLEKMLARVCHGREVPDEDEIERMLKHKITPYQPFGQDGPTITVDQAVSLLHRYCQKLPKDGYTTFVPEFIVDTINDKYAVCSIDPHTSYATLYFVTVQLPMNCPLKEPIKCSSLLPRVKLAKKAAALDAIKILHAAGEFDDHLKPVSHKDIDSDEEDDEKMKERQKEHAGTDRRNMYYRNEVSSCLQNNLPEAEKANYLYEFIQTRSKADGTHFTDLFCVSVLTNRQIPYAKIPQFSLYTANSDEVSVCIRERQFPFPLDVVKLEILKCFHSEVFLKVLNIGGLDVSFEHSDRQYLIVPTVLEFETAENYMQRTCKIIDDISKGLTGTDPCVADTLVAKNYTDEIHHGQQQLYEVISVNMDETPLSQFPGDQSITYAQYFLNKYVYQFINYDQPSLTCKALSLGLNSLRLASSAHSKDSSSRRRSKNEIKLFPELCHVWPLSASLWKSFRCIPALLYRLESLMLINDLSDHISASTGIGYYSDYEYSTKSLLSADDCTSRKLESEFYVNENETVDSKLAIDLERFALQNGSHRKPDNSILLRSLTTRSANDSVNLERLETLGDSFLKLLTTIDLFCSRSSDHEGKLTTARKRRISNFNLCFLAKKKGLPGKLLTKQFEPMNSWIPPCFCLHGVIGSPPGPAAVSPNTTEVTKQVLDYCYHKATDKTVADSVEAMLGAYLIAGGIEAAIIWLCWIGLKLSWTSDVEMKSRSSSQVSVISYDPDNISMATVSSTDDSSTVIQATSINLPLLVSHSSPIFRSCGLVACSPLLGQNGDNAYELVHNMIASCLPRTPRPEYTDASLCEKLGWNFAEPALLLQALTHPSYQKNRLTDYYQRLEFLGDAVLDYLITCYIFCQFPNYTPGEITNARSALVNNITFAEIAVKDLQLHKYLLHSSPFLFSQITEYVQYLSSDGTSSEQQSEIYCSSEDSDFNVDVTTEDVDSDIEELEPPKALGDVLESVAGALFLDCGMNLEIVWSKFYPFFKPLVDRFKNGGPPIHPLKELFELDSKVEIIRSVSERPKRHCCTVKVIDKGIVVKCTAKSFKTAKYGAAKRAVSKIKSSTI